MILGEARVFTQGRRLMVIGDATGPGRPLVDRIRESGIDIIPFNFGGHTDDDRYKDEGTRV